MIDYDLSNGVCVLCLNCPPVNAITFDLLEELRRAIRRANSDGGVRGIVITGDARHFSAGADVNIFREVKCAEDAVTASRVFQEAFGEVEDSEKPVVAAAAGKVMGSALELPMACHFRVCTRGAKFSMPEVKLGIVPGAGGTQRLPRLVGAEMALKMLLTGEAIGAEQALDAGLVDVVSGGEELVEEAARLLESECAVRRTRERTDRVRDVQANEAAFGKAKKLLDATRPEIIAPAKIAEAVRAGIEESFEAGLRAEQTGFAECMDTLATQNRIYLFFATRETSKAQSSSDARPREVAKAAVVGMGSMGTGIAHAVIIGGVPVVVRDENETALQRGIGRIRSSVHKRVQQGKLAEERAAGMLSLIATTTAWEDIADADVVVEAVFEDIDVKRAVIAGIEKACPSDTIIASNTSTLSLDVLAEGMQHPERLVGMHFFNPAHAMPLVEVIRRDETPGQVIATALKFAKTIRKTPVLVRNQEGFLVNRMFIPYLKEAFWLLEEGATAPAIDAAMVAFGFPMGPLALIDMAGIDILVHTDRVMSQAYPQQGRLSPIAVQLVEQGHLGQKTESGVYKYEGGDYTPCAHGTTERLICDVQREKDIAPREVSDEEITQRLVLRMVAEAFRTLEEGLVERESDVDAAMVLGAGFPDFRGGVVKYARDLGIGSVVSQLDDLTALHGERFAPCERLRDARS